MDYALSSYPLSSSYRQRLERTMPAAPTYMLLNELRSLPLPRLLRKLLTLNANRLVIAVENESSRALLPAFYCIAALAKARSAEIVGPDLRREKISYWRTIKSIGAMLRATADGWRVLRRSRREVAQLLDAPRLALVARPNRPVLYAKANLNFGVTAGGSVGHVAGVVSGFHDNGYPVDFFAVERPAVLHDQTQFHQIDAPTAYGLPYDCNLYRYQDLFIERTAELAAHKDYAFVYQRMSIGNFSGVALSRRLRIPLVLEYNGSEVWVSKNWAVKLHHQRLAEQSEAACLRHAHVVVTVSEVLRDELIERGVEPARIVCYPNCVDPRMYRPDRFSASETAAIRDRHGIARDAVVASFVGTFGPWHGAEVLAEAIRRMAADRSDWLRQNRVHFMLVGDGVGMKRVRELLDNEHCRPFVTLTGLVPQDEAPRYIAASDLLLSPHVPNADGSRFFGSPTKLFEYMAMGKPIVATDLEQIGQVLKDSLRVGELPDCDSKNECRPLAVLAKPGDADELIEGIRFLVDQSSWRERLGHNACREALDRYTWDKHVAAVLQCLFDS